MVRPLHRRAVGSATHPVCEGGEGEMRPCVHPASYTRLTETSICRA